MSPIVNIPAPKKPAMCIWKDLSVHHIDQIVKETTTDGKTELLRTILKLDSSSRSEILLDLFLHALQFAKLHKLSKAQISALVSIVKQTHEVCASTPFGNIQECFQYFRELMLIHSVHRPPWSIELYDTQQLEEITNYVINSYFRHYKLYKYTFTPKVRLDLSIHYEGRVPSPEPVELDSQEDGRTTPGTESISNTSPHESESETPVPITPQPEPLTEEGSELEALVRKAVTDQLKQMQLNVERQLDDADKSINEKIQNLEQGGGTTPKGRKSRSPKGSGKSKKK